MATPIRQPDGSNCYSGVNCRRHGAYNSALQNNVANAVKFQLDNARNTNQRPPVVVEPGKLVAWPHPVAEQMYHAAEYEYDSYGCYGCYGCETGDDYCRGASYEGLRVVVPNARELLAGIYKCSPNDIPGAMVKIARDAGVEDADYWEIESVGGYYGDEVVGPTFTGDKRELEKIDKMFWNSDNARDPNGILSYIRERGTETQGLFPLDALKKQLIEEHGEKMEKLIGKTTDVSSSRLQHQQVTVDKRRLDAATPRKSYPVDGDFPILGVVHRTGTGKFELLDGYGRYKSLKQGEKPKDGFYLVLS